VDDLEIIKRVQAGDSESFGFLVEKYHNHLLNFIYRLVGDRQIVEDIGQEIFLNLYKSIGAFNVSRGVPFSAWLFVTARNRCISELRRKRMSTLSIEETGDLSAPTRTPEQIACDEERLQAIREALEQLQEPFKSTILQSLQGSRLEEIALNSRISRGTAKSRLFRAREKMRLWLCEHFGGNRYGQF
jgi:RNA polymerase sigma-70 factor, ECF subfamily